MSEFLKLCEEECDWDNCINASLITIPSISSCAAFIEWKKKISESYQKLCERYSKMLSDEKYADVTLQCIGGELKAHKVILSSNSDVFDRMFQNNMMMEAKKIEVECKFDIATMKMFLEYMYSGKLDKSKVASLFKAADYYGVQQLKIVCEEAMMTELNSKNAIATLELAQSFNRSTLKQHVLKFIRKNSKAVIASDDYRALRANDSPSLVMIQILYLIIEAVIDRQINSL